MINRNELLAFLDAELNPQQLSDYCPNGLQVAGKTQIKKIITGVTASQRLIDAAVAEQADALFVHHGYFWKNEDPCITGIKRQRLQTLLSHDINLFAYHLPLDVHKTWGNNVGLAKALSFTVTGTHRLGGIDDLLWQGELASPLTTDEFSAHIAKQLNREPTIIKANDAPIKRVAWCTGAADNYIADAHQLGVDAFLSGELSESTVHSARELGLHYFACGHHATERYGVRCMSNVLAKKFNLDCQFIDCDSPA